jgi:hypothetical protein
MRRLLALLLLAGACSERPLDDGTAPSAPPDLAPAPTALDITVDAVPPISNVDHLRVSISQGTRVATFDEPLSPRPATIPPQQHVEAIFPNAGTVSVEVIAVDPNGKELINGKGSTTLLAGQEVQLKVLLTPFE